ncbi:filamin-A-like, partial [Limulus polyphemus]|uniref:Filamin-A-like n=1 Tax=Limulus polyphemus TaxID=6850 RepID=A0ABM1TG20_LIMPO
MSSGWREIPGTQSGLAGQDEIEDDEMERELAEDAAWKKIQQNTFTRWANEHLKTANKTIGNLDTDLSDGLRLIALVEVLSGKKLPRHNKRPNFRSQKLENVSVALLFLQNDEGIKIVNIDSSDIVDCKLKLILGLIWTLILHYSISMPMWEGEDANILLGEKGGPTPKQRLLGWIQSKLPDLPVQNFTTDWKDGIAVGALVDAVAPGLCPDWSDWSPNNALGNASEAMNLADDWLGVPQLIKPEEMVNPNIDELSMMTYLSQYPNAKLKPGAPLRPRTNPNRIRCYGPGIEPSGVVCGAPTNFTVETFSAGKGDIEVFVENPSGMLEPVEVKYNNDRSKTYTVTYTASMEGTHRVKVTFAGKEVPKSPFLVTVEGHAGDPKKVTASGPGLEPNGVMVGRPTYFDVFTKDAGRGQVEVIILDQRGDRTTVPWRVRKIDEDVYRCEYVCQTVGLLSVNIFFAGQLIPNSPFGVKVSPVCDARKVRVSGRGIQPRGIRVRDIADFKVFTEGAGQGDLDVKVIGPGGINEYVDINKLDDSTYECIYRPMNEGRYVITVSYGGQEVPHSPFELNVGPYKESKICAYGPGLDGGVVGYPACFTVDTNGETGSLGFSIEGPSQAKIECDDNGDGSADVKYFPLAPGDYAVHILCNNEDIPKSPFVAQILPKTDYFPEKVEAFGSGIDKYGVTKNKPVDFTVDIRKAGGHAPLDINIIDEEYRPVDLKVQDNKDGTYTCSYCPTKSNKHTIQVNYGGVAILNSPYRVLVSEPTDLSKVRVFGPGVESGVKEQTPTHFNVDAQGCGQGDVNVVMTDDRGNIVPVQVQDNRDETYVVDYIPPTCGDYKVVVLFAGKEVPGSPLYVHVKPKVDVSKVKVDGLEPSVFVDSPTEFVVDARAASKRSDAKVHCTITNPSGARTSPLVQNFNDGTYKISYTPLEEGYHTIDISYDGVPVPGSPFKVNVTKGCDHKKCRAFGPGLEKGYVDKVNVFTVDIKSAGTGGLGLAIEGPSEAKMTCQDNRDGSCTVEYIPTEPGDYDILINFANQSIPGSPFKVPVTFDLDASKVQAYGPGVESENCRVDLPLQFTVDAKKVPQAPLAVEVQSEYGAMPKKPEIKDRGDSLYDVTYFAPPENSLCNLKVTYGGQDIEGSPFQMLVKPTYEPEKVQVYGAGVDKKGVPASLPTEFTIDTKKAGFAEPEVYVKGPDGKKRKTKLTNNNDGTYSVSYVPDDLGEYQVSVFYGGQEVPNSPFLVNSYPVGQAEKCRITEGVQEKIAIGEEYCITVNAEQAGKGAVNCHISSTSDSVSDADIEVEDNGDGTFSIYYTVKEVGEYMICITFGGQPVPGGVYTAD